MNREQMMVTAFKIESQVFTAHRLPVDLQRRSAARRLRMKACECPDRSDWILAGAKVLDAIDRFSWSLDAADSTVTERFDAIIALSGEVADARTVATP